MTFPRTVSAPHAIAAGIALPLAFACASPPAPGDALEPISPAPAELRVRLAFGAEADLDLYVTGPSLETVYFANDASREGGRLDRDVRCDTSGARVETVSFAGAAPGPYRIGIDFPERCRSGVDEADWALEVEGPGTPRTVLEGRAVFGVFDSRVHTLELAD